MSKCFNCTGSLRTKEERSLGICSKCDNKQQQKPTYKNILQQRQSLLIEHRNLLVSRIKINKELRKVTAEMNALDNHLVNDITFD